MTFSAKKRSSAGQKTGSADAGTGPANSYDGNWFGTTSDGKRFRFVVKDNLVDDVDMTLTIPDGDCEGYRRDQWGHFNHQGTVWDIQQSYNEELRKELASKAVVENGSFRAVFGKRFKAVFTGRFAAPGEASGEFSYSRIWQEMDRPPCKLELRGTWEAIRP
jgi:hypothetical protein